MQIHNYYSDLLLSVRSLFDNIVFGPNIIKHYDFNIANRAFAIDKEYKTQFEFPACIVTLNDDQYIFGERPNVIQRVGPENKMQHNALYNLDNHRTVVVQEEHVQTSISIIINCESQLQAKDVEFTVKRCLPTSKYIQILEFTSFLEIPFNYLTALEFDLYGHKILNLFTKLSENTGKVEHCFSMAYKPHIRLESINTSIADSSTRSFPVNIEVSYLTQMPMFIFASQEPKAVETINLYYSRLGNDPIADYPVQKILNVFKDIMLEEDLGSPIPKRVTENGKWAINLQDGSLVWIDRFTNDVFPVASKPEDGEWRIDSETGYLMWVRTDGTIYYVDEEKDTLRKDNPDGQIFLKTGMDFSKLFDSPKTHIRRTFIIKDEKDILVDKTNDRVLFCVTFNINDFEIKKGYHYNFVNNRGEIIRDYPYLSYDSIENKVCFEVPRDEWELKWKPSLTTPLMVQFLEEIPSSFRCSDFVTSVS
jgi:phosphoenolpyruvate synthase/pyruvate phosphate dikinase